MKKVTNFDVLIVYSEKLANSASLISKTITAPFPKKEGRQNYNLVYNYFLKICKKNSIKAAFTTSCDIIGTGMCQSYWLIERNKWVKKQGMCFSKLIFDKFSPTTKRKIMQRNLLFSSIKIKSFNNPKLSEICFDKQKTSEILNCFSIPTVSIKSRTKKGLLTAQKFLEDITSKNIDRDDFSKDIILKDRFGAGGLRVYKYNKNQYEKILELINVHKNVSFIIQPFVKFDKGFKFKNTFKPTEIRLIFLGRKIIQTYIRIAKKGSFKCNEHAGGLLKYISEKKLPLKIKEVSKNIVKILNIKSSLYALDFIISNNHNVYFLEANTAPGLDWNLSIKKNEIETKKLIRIVVKEITRRTSSSKRKFVKAKINTPIFNHPYNFIKFDQSLLP